MVPMAHPTGLVRLLAITAAASAALVMASSGSAHAAVRYGFPPPGAPVPGGYSQVCTSQTIGPAGGRIGPLWCAGSLDTLRVPPGALPFRLQFTVTAADLDDIGDAGFPGYRAVAGAGIRITRGGAEYHRLLSKPARLTMRAPWISCANTVVAWFGTRWVKWQGAVDRLGRASVSFAQSDPDFAVLDRIGCQAPAAGAAGHGGLAAGRGRSGSAPGSTAARYGGAAAAHPGAAAMHQAARTVHQNTKTMHQSARTRAHATAVLARDKARLAADPGTGSHSGLPAEVLLTAALLLTGAGGLAYVRRRRTRARGASED